METIYIKKQAKGVGQEASHFVVPAVAINTKDGVRTIPHPYGSETRIYETLEKAIEQVHRAGYAAEFEGKHYPMPTRQLLQRPRALSGSAGQAPIMKILQNAIPELQGQLNDNVPSVVASAAYALGELKDDSALPGLLHALGNDDASVRKNAGEALAKIGKPSLKTLQLALKDKNWVVRHSALAALVELIHLNIDLAGSILADALPLLKDDSWLVRSQAANVFGEAAKVSMALQEKVSSALTE